MRLSAALVFYLFSATNDFARRVDLYDGDEADGSSGSSSWLNSFFGYVLMLSITLFFYYAAYKNFRHKAYSDAAMAFLIGSLPFYVLLVALGLADPLL